MSEMLEISGELPILVIDSVASFRDLMSMILKKLGFRSIFFAIDAGFALQVLRSQKIGLIICDRNLPQCSGMELLKEIREMAELERMPFMMMSGDIPKEDVVLASEFGIDGYLKKPFVINDVTARLTASLARFQDSSNPEHMFEAARKSFRAEKYEEAEQIYLEVRKINPASARSFVGIARCHRFRGNLAEAAVALNAAIKQNPMYVHAYHDLGIVHLQAGKVEEALAAFSKAVEISPSNPIRYESIAEILMERGRYAEAEKYLMKAIKLELAFPNLYALLGKAFFAQKKTDKAIEFITKALQQQPNNTSFLNSLGICMKAEGRFDAAVDCYNKALKQRPSDTKILFNKALCFVSMKEWERARKVIAQILKVDPSFDKAHSKLKEIGQLENAAKNEPQS
jgi:tetratricopeptide (TPR) repeat protein